MKYMIPKIIHIFWNDLRNIPEVVKLLIQNIKLKIQILKLYYMVKTIFHSQFIKK